jgi:hypothetical protein
VAYKGRRGRRRDDAGNKKQLCQLPLMAYRVVGVERIVTDDVETVRCRAIHIEQTSPRGTGEPTGGGAEQRLHSVLQREREVGARAEGEWEGED